MEKMRYNAGLGMETYYQFHSEESTLIAESLQKHALKLLDRKISKIENDPKNEGQATYGVRLDSLYRLKQEIEEIIKEFS